MSTNKKLGKNENRRQKQHFRSLQRRNEADKKTVVKHPRQERAFWVTKMLRRLTLSSLVTARLCCSSTHVQLRKSCSINSSSSAFDQPYQTLRPTAVTTISSSSVQFSFVHFSSRQVRSGQVNSRWHLSALGSPCALYPLSRSFPIVSFKTVIYL